jgi:uncharacterized protein (DUF1800 family)
MRINQLCMPMAERLLAASLCFLMVAQPQNSFAAGASKKSRPVAIKQIEGDERILHALNRFTFGPRPGDLEEVKKIGLDRWFEAQLHPDKLDQSALNEQLALYPSIQKLNTAELMERFPNDRMIRAASTEKYKLPDNTIERAVYSVQVMRYKERTKADDERKKREALAEKQANDPSQTVISSATKSSTTTPVAANVKPAVLDTTKLDTSKNGAPNGITEKSTDSSAASMSSDPSTMNSMASPPSDIAAEQKKEQDAKSRNEALAVQILNLPPDQRIKRMLSFSPENLDAIRRTMNQPERQMLTDGMDPEDREIALALDDPRKIVVDEMMDERVVRDLYSNAQLDEVMTDFWLNHFNIFLRKNEEMPYFLATFERDVIRPRSLGKFEDLLEATAHSPAMMLYLDNASSVGPNSPAAIRNQGKNKKASEGLNENYARELMELHTVGVNGGYTQADVTSVARILTGWGVDKPQQGGDFNFNEKRHEPGTKVVMGQSFHEDGEKEGRALIHMLATRPETANFICRKLAIRFVSDDPPATLVNRMAKTFLSSGGDITEVLRTLFHSPEFWNVENYHSKVKTPSEFVLSAIRASGVQPKNPQPVVNAIRDMGMPFYGAVPPTGYTWKSDAWVTSGDLVSRMNFALGLTTNRLQGCTKNWAGVIDAWQYQTQISVVPAKEEERLEAELIAGGVNPATRAAILRQIAPLPVAATSNPSTTLNSQPVATQLQPAQSQTALLSTPLPQPAQSMTQAETDYFNAPIKITPDQLEQKDELLAGLLMGSPEFQRR